MLFRSKRPARRRAGDPGEQDAGAHDRQLLALRDDRVRLCPAIDAVLPAALADGQRGLRGHRLSAQPERNHRGAGRDECRDASQSEDAQPRQLHSGPALEAPGAVTSFRTPSSSRRVVNPSNLARTIPLPSTTKIHGSERRFHSSIVAENFWRDSLSQISSWMKTTRSPSAGLSVRTTST